MKITKKKKTFSNRFGEVQKLLFRATAKRGTSLVKPLGLSSHEIYASSEHEFQLETKEFQQ